MAVSTTEPPGGQPRPDPVREPLHDLAHANLRWNFAVNVLDVSFITLGMSLVSRETVMPLLVSQLTDSKVAVGMIAAIWGLGIYLPQLLTANYAEGLRYKKPFLMVISSVGERLPYLLMGLAVWFFAVPAPNLALLLFFIFLAISAFAAGAGTPAWYDMIAKAIPLERRGLWAGLSSSLGALMGIAGAFLVGRVLEAFAFPLNFSLLFGLAFVAVCVSFVGLALNREPPSEITKVRQTLLPYLRQLPAILRKDANYRRYLLSRTVVIAGAMATGFIIVYGSEKFGLDGAQVGLLTATLIGGQAVMSLVWGLLGDRWGHKLVMTLAAFALTLAMLVTLLAPTWQWLMLTFVLLGAYFTSEWVSGLNLILEFCDPADRPTYIGLTNTLLAPPVVLAPLLGGLLATFAGYAGLLLAATLVAATGALLMLFWVAEPRKLPQPTATQP
jgi:MFS family permease